MGKASIPVNLVNPGQVFACLGFLEAAELLCGPAEAGFSWDTTTARFHLKGEEVEDPVACVLKFVADAQVVPVAPITWSGIKNGNDLLERVPDSPTGEPSETALPICLQANGLSVHLSHWADGSSRDAFKLYSGNRSASTIATTMIHGRTTAKGRVAIKGIRHLLESEDLVRDPLGVTTPLGGSFNFDARCTWQSIDTGYSPNDHGQKVVGSPVVELMAAWGLEHARPQQRDRRVYSYGVWGGMLPPVLARPALTNSLGLQEYRSFVFELGMSGKNKIVGYAEEERTK